VPRRLALADSESERIRGLMQYKKKAAIDNGSSSFLFILSENVKVCEGYPVSAKWHHDIKRFGDKAEMAVLVFQCTRSIFSGISIITIAPPITNMLMTARTPECVLPVICATAPNAAGPITAENLPNTSKNPKNSPE